MGGEVWWSERWGRERMGAETKNGVKTGRRAEEGSGSKRWAWGTEGGRVTEHGTVDSGWAWVMERAWMTEVSLWDTLVGLEGHRS